MKRPIALVGIIVGVVLLATVSASALSWDYTQDGRYGPPESSVVIGREQVAQEKIGRLCNVTVDIGNNDSLRDGSTIIVETGVAAHVFGEVEKEKGNRPPVVLQMTMGDTLIVELVFGPEVEWVDADGEGLAAFSGSGVVTVGNCTDVTPPPPNITINPPPVINVTPPPAPPVVVAARFTG